MIKNEKKQKEREKKEFEAINRKHLASMRVVQKSLVYVIGLPAKLACDEVCGICSNSRARKLQESRFELDLMLNIALSFPSVIFSAHIKAA